MIGGGRYSQDGFVEATNSVEMFSFKTRNTSSILPMRCKRSAPAAASSSNEIAVCGGWWNNTCELYQSSTGKWRDLPSMNEKRCDFSVVWLPDGQLIATGGYDDKDEILSSVEVLKHPWNAGAFYSLIESSLTYFTQVTGCFCLKRTSRVSGGRLRQWPANDPSMLPQLLVVAFT